MARFRCVCGEVIVASGPIPNPIEWRCLSDQDFYASSGLIQAEDVYTQSTIMMRCPTSDHLWFFWKGFDQPPTLYAPRVSDLRKSSCAWTVPDTADPEVPVVRSLAVASAGIPRLAASLRLLEVPPTDAMRQLPVDVVVPSPPGAISVTAWANDGDSVTLTWDEIAGSAHLRWLVGNRSQLVLERETVIKIAVREVATQIEFSVLSRSSDVGGELVVRTGDHVTVSDVILRK